MSEYKPQAGIAINNAILDPLQGFDADIWILDQATGKNFLVGRFTSFQLTVRNSTEPYLEMNQRIPRYLDGEIQIGWVCERGLLDVRVLEQTFGFADLSREQRLNRQPRFNITVQISAEELNQSTLSDAKDGSIVKNGTIGNGELSVGVAANSGAGDLRNNYNKRKSSGELVLQYCKLDSFTMGIMAGRSVIANRWEGLAEGISFVDRTHVWAGTQAQQGTLDENVYAQNNIRQRLKGVGLGAEGVSLPGYGNLGNPNLPNLTNIPSITTSDREFTA